MSSERWLRVKQLFADALPKDREARAAFLAEACAGDPELRREVESLLLAEEQAHAEFMDAPTIAAATRPWPAGYRQAQSPAEPALPLHFGRYRIVRLIGEGGMGVVYEAEQENPRRAVALKVIQPGYASSERLRRFVQEADMLAGSSTQASPRSTKRVPPRPIQACSPISSWSS